MIELSARFVDALERLSHVNLDDAIVTYQHQNQLVRSLFVLFKHITKITLGLALSLPRSTEEGGNLEEDERVWAESKLSAMEKYGFLRGMDAV